MNSIMAEPLELTVNGRRVSVRTGATVSVAVALAGITCRSSVTGEPRSTMCGMGVCFECRVMIDGKAHQRACQTLCQPGMDIKTSA